MTTTVNLTPQLRQNLLFRYLSDGDVELLLSQTKLLEKQTGEPLVLVGEQVIGLYLITAGECGVYPEHARAPISKIPVGGTFGEMSFLEGLSASATIRAEQPRTKVLVFAKNQILKLMETHPWMAAGFYHGIAQSLSQKLRTTNARFSKDLTHTRQIAREVLRSDTAQAESESDVVATLTKRLTRTSGDVENKLKAIADEIAQLAAKTPDRMGSLTALEMSLKQSVVDLKKEHTIVLDQMGKINKLMDAFQSSLLMLSGSAS